MEEDKVRDTCGMGCKRWRSEKEGLGGDTHTLTQMGRGPRQEDRPNLHVLWRRMSDSPRQLLHLEYLIILPALTLGRDSQWLPTTTTRGPGTRIPRRIFSMFSTAGPSFFSIHFFRIHLTANDAFTTRECKLFALTTIICLFNFSIYFFVHFGF